MSPSYRTGAPVSSRWDGDFLLLHRTPKHAFTSKPLPLRLLGKEKTDLDSKVGGSTYLSKAGSIHLSGIAETCVCPRYVESTGKRCSTGKCRRYQRNSVSTANRCLKS